MRWSETGPVATGIYRMGGAGIVLLVLPFLVPSTKPLLTGKVSRADKLWLAAAGLLFAADIAAWHPALLLTTVEEPKRRGLMGGAGAKPQSLPVREILGYLAGEWRTYGPIFLTLAFRAMLGAGVAHPVDAPIA